MKASSSARVAVPSQLFRRGGLLGALCDASQPRGGIRQTGDDSVRSHQQVGSEAVRTPILDSSCSFTEFLASTSGLLAFSSRSRVGSD